AHSGRAFFSISRRHVAHLVWPAATHSDELTARRLVITFVPTTVDQAPPSSIIFRTNAKLPRRPRAGGEPMAVRAALRRPRHHDPSPPTNKSWMAGAAQRCQDADKTFPRITAHDLRHTAASLAISADANVKVVQRMLGHA